MILVKVLRNKTPSMAEGMSMSMPSTPNYKGKEENSLYVLHAYRFLHKSDHCIRESTLILVMLKMVSLERYRCRQADDDISKDAQETVSHGSGVTKGQIVTDLVNRERHGVIDGATKHVRGQDNQRPRERGHGVSGNHLRTRQGW